MNTKKQIFQLFLYIPHQDSNTIPILFINVSDSVLFSTESVNPYGFFQLIAKYLLFYPVPVPIYIVFLQTYFRPESGTHIYHE